MTLIMEELDKINSQFAKMKVEKLIPCNCNQCKTDSKPYFHQFGDLKRRIEKGKKEVECTNSYEMISVRGLIDEVINEEILTRNKVFISYSHKNRKWLERVQTHLKVIEKLDIKLNLWDDTQIKSGSKWMTEIEEGLLSAKVAILLVSTDFLASDFIDGIELPSLLKAAEDDDATILPLILEPCLFAEHKLSEFQSINDPAKPLSKLRRNGQEEQIGRAHV